MTIRVTPAKRTIAKSAIRACQMKARLRAEREALKSLEAATMPTISPAPFRKGTSTMPISHSEGLARVLSVLGGVEISV